jgi:hypothetical protein
MAITESTNSRRYHYTREGETITQIFTCTWADADAGTDGTTVLPVIGTPWHRLKPHVTCTDINIAPVPNNNTMCEFVATFSSGGMRWSEYQPDTIASTQLLFDYQWSPQTSDEYWDYGTSQTESWEAIATAAGLSDPVPPRYPERPRVALTVRGRVSMFKFAILYDYLGTINSTNFLPLYADRYVVDSQGLNTPIDCLELPYNYSDVGFWLFAGFRAEMVGRDTSAVHDLPNYEITSTFLHDPNGWNTPYPGLTGYTAYESKKFDSLPRPQQHGTFSPGGIRT